MSAVDAPARTLGLAALPSLAPAQRPRTDPRDLQPRVVHLGLGAFHRAHGAVLTEEAAAASGEPWGVAAVAPRSRDVVAALRRQDALWSVTDLAPGEPATRVVGAMVEALHLGDDAARVDALLAAPTTGVVTLTVTEKGYHRRPTDGALDVTDPAVAADLAALAAGRAPGTALGRLVAGLVARYRAGGAPLSVVACDNLADNGTALHRVVTGMLEAGGPADRDAVLTWLDADVTFPSTLVDRIVPATSAADLDRAARSLGVRDDAAVVGEPYRQWVLQDAFAAARPPWERAGALVVADVAPWERMKLRLLNGAHSALAWTGLAAGCTTVADVMATAWGEDLVRRLGAEVAPTLDPALDPAAYVDDLVARFRNPALEHRLVQIGSDGSLKVPERWLGAVRELRAAGRGTPVLETALAAWADATRPADDAVVGVGSGAARTQVHGTTDPAAGRLAAAWTGGAGGGSPADRVAALLRTVGAADLADDRSLVTAVAGRMPAARAGRPEL